MSRSFSSNSHQEGDALLALVEDIEENDVFWRGFRVWTAVVWMLTSNKGNVSCEDKSCLRKRDKEKKPTIGRYILRKRPL